MIILIELVSDLLSILLPLPVPFTQSKDSHLATLERDLHLATLEKDLILVMVEKRLATGQSQQHQLHFKQQHPQQQHLGRQSKFVRIKATSVRRLLLNQGDP